MSVYTGRYQNADSIAPHLLPVPIGDSAPELKAWLESWIDLCQGYPMVSYLSTSSSLDLKDWLQARVQIDATEERFMLRLADTRCLPQIVAALDAEQLHSFLHGIEDWRYYDRQGTLRSLQPAALQPATNNGTAFSTLRLRAEQQQHLLAMALPDTVSTYLAGKPELFGKLCGPPSSIHACIAQALAAPGDETYPNLTHDRLQSVLNALSHQGLLISQQQTQGTAA